MGEICGIVLEFVGGFCGDYFANYYFVKKNNKN
jgi:hypothetical protein